MVWSVGQQGKLVLLHYSPVPFSFVLLDLHSPYETHTSGRGYATHVFFFGWVGRGGEQLRRSLKESNPVALDYEFTFE